MRRDDLFSRHGVTWQRSWIEAAQLYVWRSTCGRYEAWMSGWTRRDVVTEDGEIIEGHPEPEYRAIADGVLVGMATKLRDVMDQATRTAVYRAAA